MKKLLSISALAVALVSPLAHAEEMHSKINLTGIKAVKTTESHGDELYLVITEFHSDGKNNQYTIPNYPVTWPSAGLAQINDLNLWQGTLQNDDVVEVIVELVEHDAPPLNIDDSIGSVRFKIAQDAGAMQVEWQKNWYKEENAAQTVTVAAKQASPVDLDFVADGGEYQLKLQLENN